MSSKLVPSDESGAGQFGSSVALSADGSTALIGGDMENGGRGAAWVFVRSGSRWVQQGSKLTPSDGAFAGHGLPVPGFGASAALSGDGKTALIGDPTDTCQTCGAVWLFGRSGSGWAQEGAKVIPSDQSKTYSPCDPESDGQLVGGFGHSVSLSADGSTAVVGDPTDASIWGTICTSPGAAWTFTRVGSSLVQDGPKFTQPSNWPLSFPGYRLGGSVAMSADGSTALVGGANAVAVLARQGSQWTENAASLMPIDPMRYDEWTAVALSAHGQAALVGATGPNDGQAQAFERSGSTWLQRGPTLIPNDESGTADFGASVAVSADGNTALIGGPHDAPSGTDAGAAWMFVNAPAVSALTPRVGSVAGRTHVAITGAGFTGATGVNFGGVPARSFVVVSDGEIDASSPPAPRGAVDVTVTTPNMTSAATPADRFTYGTVTAAPTRASSYSLRGLTAGDPTLRLGLIGGTRAPRIESITIALPRGLRFRLHPRRPLDGVTVPGLRTLRLRHGHLTVTLRRARTRIVVTIGRGAIVESSSLRRRLRQIIAYNRARGHTIKRHLTLKTGVVVVSRRHRTVRLGLSTRIGAG